MFFCKEMRAHRENARADKDRFQRNLLLSSLSNLICFFFVYVFLRFRQFSLPDSSYDFI